MYHNAQARGGPIFVLRLQETRFCGCGLVASPVSSLPQCQMAFISVPMCQIPFSKISILLGTAHQVQYSLILTGYTELALFPNKVTVIQWIIVLRDRWCERKRQRKEGGIGTKLHMKMASFVCACAYNIHRACMKDGFTCSGFSRLVST